jgi:hypothetical protein
MNGTISMIGLDDHGRRSSLGVFDDADGRDRCLYEPSRGVVAVTDVPEKRHLRLPPGLRFSIDDVSKRGGLS